MRNKAIVLAAIWIACGMYAAAVHSGGALLFAVLLTFFWFLF